MRNRHFITCSLFRAVSLAVLGTFAVTTVQAEDWGYDALDLQGGGYSGDFTRKAYSSTYIWYQAVKQSNPTATGNQWCKFNDNGNWGKQWGTYDGVTLTPNNNVASTATVDAGGSNWGWGDPGSMYVNLENGKSYIFNVYNDDDIIGGPGNDVCGFALIEVNHQSALVSFSATPTISRSGNNIVLNSKSTAENSGSSEELWFQWTHNNYSTKNFSEQETVTAEATVSIPLSTSAPILREGDPLKFLVMSTSGSALGDINSSGYSGVLGWDAYAINKSAEYSGTIADDDTAAPVASSFSVAAQTDGSIVSGGYTISGTLSDAGSGVNNNGATVTTDNFSPNFDLLNGANTQLASDQLFTTRPADGASGAVSASAPAIAAGTSIDLGTYKIRVSATDNDEDPSTSANDRTALLDSQVTTFAVTDDDTTGPTLASVTGNAITLSGANYLDTDLASGLALSMSVSDAQSGVSAQTASNRYGLSRGGVAVTTGNLTPGFASGANGTLTATIPAGFVQTVGSYTLWVTNFNYDVDRGQADQESSVNSYSFTVYANSPTITVGGGALAFGSQVVNTSGSEQSYTVSGINLTANIVITAPSGFQVSTTSGSGFGSSVTLTQSGGTVNNTTIYARFSPNNVASFSDNITHTSAGATTQNKAVTGTGTAPNNPASFSAATAGSTSVTLTFSLSAQSKPVTIVRNTDNNFTTPSGAPPSAGNAFAGGTVVYNGSASPQTDSGLSSGTLYYYKAFSYDAVNGHFYSAGLSANATTIPAAPTTTAASGRTLLGFTANWNASVGAASYRLDVSSQPDMSALLAGYSDLTVAGTSQSVTLPHVGMWYYRVRAVNAGGTSGHSDTRMTATTTAQGVNGGGTPPAATIVAPSTLYVGDDGTFAAKTWGTVSGNYGKHRVVIDTDNNIMNGGIRGSWSGFDNTDYNSATSPRFTSAGTWYWGMQIDYGSPYGTNFWMVSNNPDWADLYYAGTNVSLTVTVTALGDPTGVSAVKDGSLPAERMDLGWTRWNSRNVMIVRSLDNVFTAPTANTTYTVGNTIGGDTVIYNGSGTSFEDTGLSANTTYYYRFYSENFGYYSTGDDASETTDPLSSPNAPVATAASSVGYTSFTANWNASVGATSYRIDVARNAAFTDLVVTDHNPGNVTSYAVGGFGTGHFYYRVRAVNGGGTSPNSNTIEIGTLTAQTRNTGGGSPQVTAGTIYVGDTATFGLDSWATLNGNFGRARLWTHSTASIGSGTAGDWGSYVDVLNKSRTRQMTAAGTFYWGIQMDYGSPYGTNFWYVRDSSSYHNMYYNPTGVTLTVTVTALSDPTGVSAAQNGGSPGTAIDLAWTKWNSRDVMVVRSTDVSFGTPTPGVVYTAGNTISGDTVVYKGFGTSFTDTGLGNGTTYYYRYYSENYGYYSAGADANATTAGSAPAAPADQAATAINITSFQANWSASVGASGYRLDVSTVNNFGSFVSGFNNLDVGNVTAYTVSGLTAGNTYYYRIRAYNGGGTSGNSGSRTVILPATATVAIEEIPANGASTSLTWTATVGANYDVYYSDSDPSGSMTWQAVALGVNANANPMTYPVAEDDKRYYRVVIAGAAPGTALSPIWGVIKPTLPVGFSMQSVPLDLTDRSMGGELGNALKAVLSNGDRVYALEANGSFTTITLSSGAWDTAYTFAEGQGFFVQSASGATPRFAGPVGNDGSASRTINGAANGRWNILGLSQGKTLSFSSAFATGSFTGTPTGDWDETVSDLVVIDQGNGNWKRIMRTGSSTWLDLDTFSTPSVSLTPGSAVYYFHYGNSALSINF
jgi:hypothetical protein